MLCFLAQCYWSEFCLKTQAEQSGGKSVVPGSGRGGIYVRSILAERRKDTQHILTTLLVTRWTLDQWITLTTGCHGSGQWDVFGIKKWTICPQNWCMRGRWNGKGLSDCSEGCIVINAALVGSSCLRWKEKWWTCHDPVFLVFLCFVVLPVLFWRCLSVCFSYWLLRLYVVWIFSLNFGLDCFRVCFWILQSFVSFIY